MSTLGNKEVMANNIKRYLEKMGISRKEFCNRLGFKYSTVTDWLNAEKYPRIDKIETMANFFGINKSDLVEPPQTQDQPAPSYYHDPEVAQMANEIKDNPDMRILFDASRDLKKESIEEVVKFIEFQKAKERGDWD